jgi:hypothetical protein
MLRPSGHQMPRQLGDDQETAGSKCSSAKPRLVRLLLQRSETTYPTGPSLAVMCPNETLPGSDLECREGFPIPRRGTNGALKLLPDAG